MAKILMPKATAVWLLENTTLTFKQISDFCELHILEIQGIADGEIGAKMPGINPITSKMLTDEEIKKCEKNTKLKLKIENLKILVAVLLMPSISLGCIYGNSIIFKPFL